MTGRPMAGIVARAGRALAAAVLVAAAACGDAPSAGRSSGTRSDQVFRGEGDRFAPALGTGHIAWVDYPDGLGCVEPGECRGSLEVLSLADGAPVVEIDVGLALPALGDGFVVWSGIADPEQDGRGTVHLRRFHAGARIHRLSEENESVDVTAAPVTDGRWVAWITPRSGHRGVRVHDTETGQTTTFTTQMWGEVRGLALDGGRLAYVDRSPATYREEIVVVDLAEGTERRLDVEPEPDGRRILSPALADGYVAYKLAPQAWCTEGCMTQVVSRLLTEGGLGGSRRLDLESETVSRYGGLFATGGAALWLDMRDGPYAIFDAPLDGEGDAAHRVTPDGAVLPWMAPAAIHERHIAWVDGHSGRLEIHLGTLR